MLSVLTGVLSVLTGVLLVLTAAQPRPTCENRSLKATALTEHGCPVSVITVLAVYGFLRSRQTSKARALGLARVRACRCGTRRN